MIAQDELLDVAPAFVDGFDGVPQDAFESGNRTQIGQYMFDHVCMCTIDDSYELKGEMGVCLALARACLTDMEVQGQGEWCTYGGGWDGVVGENVLRYAVVHGRDPHTYGLPLAECLKELIPVCLMAGVELPGAEPGDETASHILRVLDVEQIRMYHDQIAKAEADNGGAEHPDCKFLMAAIESRG